MGEPAELLGGALADRTVARQDQRVLGLADELRRLGDDLVIGGRAPRLERRHRHTVDVFLGEVLRQLDHRGAGLFGLGQLERLAQDFGDVAGVVDRLRPFGDRLIHGDGVHVLVTFLVKPPGRGLADDRNEGRAVHVGVGHAGDQVRRAGTERAETDARFAGEPAIGVGHEGGGLFVAAQDELDRAFGQRNHHIGVLLAGYAEDALDPLCLQASNEQV